MHTNKKNKAKKQATGHGINFLQLVLICLIILAVNIVSEYVYTRIDLTEEKRYTLTPETVRMLRGMKDNVYIEVLLDGKFPAGFKRLQEAIKDKLDQFRNETPFIQYAFKDPLDVKSVDEKNDRIKTMAEQGIKPVNLKVFDDDEQSERIIYPYAVVKFGSHTIPVNLLENNIAGFSDEEVLNQSINLLEYKLADAINKIFRSEKPTIMITRGHGETKPIEMQDFLNTLNPYYDIRFMDLDSMYKVPEEIKLLIMPNPTEPYNEKAKFVLDQYIMRGGNTMFLVNKVKVDMDSLRRKTNDFVPIENNVNLDDLFFKYGFRIQPNLILDLECSPIPLAVGKLGTGSQMEMFPWYYAPLLKGGSSNPIVKNIDRVNVYFPNTIDTIRTKTPIKKTDLLVSSQYSRVQFIPVRINFEILRYKPDPSQFNKSALPAAVLLEGPFTSLYENRVSDEMKKTLQEIKADFVPEGKPAKIIAVSYGKLLNNLYKPGSTEYMPIGYNTFDKQLYGNRDFVMNAIEYMLDDKGILNARAKEVKLRLLDKVQIKEHKGYWQFLNLGLPLILLGTTAGLFIWYRRRKYSK